MTHQLITLTDPPTRVTRPVNGYRPQRNVADGQIVTAPEGHAYVPILDRPDPDPETQRIERHTTLDGDGWKIIDLTPEEIAARAPRPSPHDVISALHEAFVETLPPESQPAFASAYAIVRVLVEAEQWQLARATIASVEVPPELTEARDGLLEIIPNP